MATKKKDVPALVSALGVLMTIVTGLVAAVRKLGGTDEQIYKLATPEGANLLEQIAKLIVQNGMDAKQIAADTFAIVVNYAQSLKQMIEAGKYDWKNDDITDKNFPVKGEGIVELEGQLVHYGRDMEYQQVLADLDSKGLRAGTIAELLAFGASFPDEQRKYPIVALGSVGRVNGVQCVPCLILHGYGRDLNLDGVRDRWHGRDRFLAFRK